jgi:hypothetical protein
MPQKTLKPSQQNTSNLHNKTPQIFTIKTIKVSQQNKKNFQKYLHISIIFTTFAANFE